MNVKEAKKILPKAEFETFEPILMNQMSRIGVARLKQRTTMSRRLRDKYRDLSRHEDESGVNTRRARIFQEVLERLEEELDLPKRQAAMKSPQAKKKKTRTVRGAKQKALDKQLSEARYRPRD